MFLSLFRRNGSDRNIQSLTNRCGDIHQWYTLFGHGMIARACLMLFQRETVQARGIQAVHRCPAVMSVANICRDSFLTGHSDEIADKALLDRIVNLRKPDDCRAHSARFQCGTCRF